MGLTQVSKISLAWIILTSLLLPGCWVIFPVVPQAEVLDVRREADGGVTAYTTAAVPSGTDVHVSIDWANRFDLMQQHTGMRSSLLTCLACPLYS